MDETTNNHIEEQQPKNQGLPWTEAQIEAIMTNPTRDREHLTALTGREWTSIAFMHDQIRGCIGLQIAKNKDWRNGIKIGFQPSATTRQVFEKHWKAHSIHPDFLYEALRRIGKQLTPEPLDEIPDE